MQENQGILKQYSEEEIRKILNNKERLVYVDTGLEEIVARYEDLPDVIVDINDKLGSTDLKVYDYEKPDMYNPMLSTIGFFLDKCDPNVRKDIIDRLIPLQKGNEKVKDYKVIDEDMLCDIRESMNKDKRNEIER